MDDYFADLDWFSSGADEYGNDPSTLGDLWGKEQVLGRGIVQDSMGAYQEQLGRAIVDQSMGAYQEQLGRDIIASSRSLADEPHELLGLPTLGEAAGMLGRVSQLAERFVPTTPTGTPSRVYSPWTYQASTGPKPTMVMRPSGLNGLGQPASMTGPKPVLFDLNVGDSGLFILVLFLAGGYAIYRYA